MFDFLAVISLGSLHVGEVTGRGWTTSDAWILPFLCPSASFVHSLDLSELAKAAKKKLQAVSAETPTMEAALHL